MAWVDTASETFVARHDERDAADAERVLAQLEHGRARLEEGLDVALGELAVVLQGAAGGVAAGPAAQLGRPAPGGAPPARPAPPPPPPLRGRLGRRARAAR